MATACDRDRPAAPEQLADGSTAPSLRVRLEDESEPVVVTRVRVLRAGEVDATSLAAACLRSPAADAQIVGDVVERISVYATSATFRTSAGLRSCDGSSGARENGRRSCGSSFGRLYNGHLRDPRLDMAGCMTKNGRRVATAWVEARARAKYLVVHHQGFAEVYEVVAHVPVRVATVSGFRDDPLGVTFDISEHTASGGLVRRYGLEAFPAG
jgi:hypothetical protein